MNSSIRLVAVVAGLLLLLNNTPSWGQNPTAFCSLDFSPGCNPTVSDGPNNNTAGGTDALGSLTAPPFTAGGNTAFGKSALFSTTMGGANTASGAWALFFNTTGSGNTASGFFALEHNTTGD